MKIKKKKLQQQCKCTYVCRAKVLKGYPPQRVGRIRQVIPLWSYNAIYAFEQLEPRTAYKSSVLLGHSSASECR